MVEITERFEPTTPAAVVIGDDSSVCHGFIFFSIRTSCAIRLFVDKIIEPDVYDQRGERL